MVAEILKEASDDIGIILKNPEDELHKLKLQQGLKRMADQIILITGSGDLENTAPVTLGPAKTIGGRSIEQIPKFTEADLAPSDDKVLQLKKDVESAYNDFASISAEEILAGYTDLVIRGVAKKLGMKVTKDNPASISIDFINEIKSKLVPKELEIPALPTIPEKEPDVSDTGNADLDKVEQLKAAQERQAAAQQAYDAAKNNLDAGTKANKPAKDLKSLKAAFETADAELLEATIAVEELQK